MQAHTTQIKKFSHPANLWWISATYACYMMAFITLLVNLFLFLNTKLLIPQSHAFEFNAAFSSLIFVMPLFGGYIGDRLGLKLAAIVGLFFCLFGMILLSVHNEWFSIMGLSVFIAGSAYCTPCIWSLINMLYDKNQYQQGESGTTWFYLIINIGALISSAVSGFLIRDIGYHDSFLIFGSFLIPAIIIFLRRYNTIYTEAHDSKAIIKNPSVLKNVAWLVLIAIMGSILITFLFKELLLTNILLWLAVIAAFAFVLTLIKKSPELPVKLKMYGFLVLCIAAVFYITIYSTEYGVIIEYVKLAVNRKLLGITIPPSAFAMLDALFVILFGPILAWLWISLDRRNKRLSIPAKFSIGLVSSALGFLLLVFAIVSSGSDIKIHILWIVVAFAFFVIAELLILPTGIAMSGQLAPDGREGLFMGVWNLMTGWGAILAGYVGSLTATSAVAGLKAINDNYMHAYLIIGCATLIAGIVLFTFVPTIKKMIHQR